MEHMDRIPSFLLPLIGIVSGILAGYAGAGIIWGFILSGMAAALYLYIRFSSRDAMRSYRLAPLHHLWIALLFAGIGVLDQAFNAPAPLEIHDYTNGVCEGEITDVRTTAYGERYTVRILSVTDTLGNRVADGVSKCIVATNASGSPRLSRGKYVRFKSSLIPIAPIENGPGFDYVKYQKNKGILYTQKKRHTDMTVTGEVFRLRNMFIGIRDRAEIFIETSGLERQTSHFLITLLLGDKDYLDKGVRASFADAGISHILALSGMHVGIITMIVMALLFPINFTGNYKLRYWLAIIAVWGYILLTGLSPSAVRAAIMATTAFAAIIAERRNNIFNALLIALFVILLCHPSSMFDVGLQLSALCVASLITFSDYYNTVDRHTHPRLYKCMAALLATLTATFGSWVVVAWYFGLFSPMFLVANLVTLPLLPLYLCGALLYLALSATGLELHPLAYTLDVAYDMLCRFTSFISADGSGALAVTVTGLTVASWLAGLLILGIGIHRKRSVTWRYAGYCILCLSIASIWLVS